MGILIAAAVIFYFTLKPHLVLVGNSLYLFVGPNNNRHEFKIL
jgi:hypothetical protein